MVKTKELAERFIQKKEAFLPVSYPDKAVKEVFLKFGKFIPWYYTDGYAFTITRFGDYIFIGRILKLLRENSTFSAIKKIFTVSVFLNKEKIPYTGSSYDRKIPLYESIADKVEESYEVFLQRNLIEKTKELPSAEETYLPPYFPFYTFPDKRINANEFMAVLKAEDFENIEELIYTADLCLSVRGAVSIFTRDFLTAAILKKTAQKLNAISEVRKVFVYISYGEKEKILFKEPFTCNLILGEEVYPFEVNLNLSYFTSS